MSRLSSSGSRGVSGYVVCAALWVHTGLSCHALQFASSPGSTGWLSPSQAGSGWSAGLCTAQHWVSRHWFVREQREWQVWRLRFPFGCCWQCALRAQATAAWPTCAWSFSLWLCTGRCRHLRAAGSAKAGPDLCAAHVHLNESERRSNHNNNKNSKCIIQ